MIANIVRLQEGDKIISLPGSVEKVALSSGAEGFEAEAWAVSESYHILGVTRRVPEDFAGLVAALALVRASGPGDDPDLAEAATALQRALSGHPFAEEARRLLS